MNKVLGISPSSHSHHRDYTFKYWTFQGDVYFSHCHMSQIFFSVHLCASRRIYDVEKTSKIQVKCTVDVMEVVAKIFIVSRCLLHSRSCKKYRVCDRAVRGTRYCRCIISKWALI